MSRSAFALIKPPVGLQRSFLPALSKALVRLYAVKSLISIVFVSSVEIKKLNHRYRGKNVVTDVLSFAYDNGPKQVKGKNREDSEALGEIIICWPQLKKQALERNHSVKIEFLILVVHGCLHLLGYEHDTEKKRKKMETEEQNLIKVVTKSLAKK